MADIIVQPAPGDRLPDNALQQQNFAYWQQQQRLGEQANARARGRAATNGSTPGTDMPIAVNAYGQPRLSKKGR